jgi:hypothetical protein
VKKGHGEGSGLLAPTVTSYVGRSVPGSTATSIIRTYYSSIVLAEVQYYRAVSSRTRSTIVRVRWAKLRDSSLLPIVLVVALLSCHGALGALHDVSPVPSAEHPSAAKQGAFSGQHLVHHLVAHPGCLDYAAALTAVFVGAALALLLNSARAWRSTCAPPLAAWGFPTIFVASLPPARGAPSPFLQVFRL